MARKIVVDGSVETTNEKVEVRGKVNLNQLVSDYITKKKTSDALEKEVKKMNAQIKDELISRKLSSFDTKEGSVLLGESKTISFDEAALTEWLKKNKFDDCFKKVEILDYDELENKTYHGVIDPEKLRPFQVVKTTQKLNVKEVKDGKKAKNK